MDGVDVVPLEWKKGIEKRSIFPMTYRRFSMLWHLSMLFLGARTVPRPYSLRVGAVGKYIGKKYMPGLHRYRKDKSR